MRLSRQYRLPVLGAALLLVITAPAASQSFTAVELAAKARELGAPGMIATFRNKTLSVTGTLGSFMDTGYGDYVYVYFQHEHDSSWKVTCGFERSDTAQYDRFALMQPGTPISATGRFKTVHGSYYFIELEPCGMN